MDPQSKVKGTKDALSKGCQNPQVEGWLGKQYSKAMYQDLPTGGIGHSLTTKRI